MGWLQRSKAELLARARSHDRRRRLSYCFSAWARQADTESQLLQEKLALAGHFAFASTLRKPSDPFKPRMHAHLIEAALEVAQGLPNITRWDQKDDDHDAPV